MNWSKFKLSLILGSLSLFSLYPQYASAQIQSSMLLNATAPLTGTIANGGELQQTNSAIAYHRLIWNHSGTISTCDAQLDTSNDGVTWSAANGIASQNCSTDGTATDAAPPEYWNYVRIHITTLTGGGTIYITYQGNVNNPAGSGGGVTFNGVVTPGDCVEVHSSSQIADAGAACGGSGISGLTTHGAVYAASATSVASTGALTNGQVLVGDTGSPPVATTLSTGSGISVTNAAGSITLGNTGVLSFNTRTGSVTPANGDYTLDQILGPVASWSPTFTLGNIISWTGATPSSVGAGTGTNADADVFSCIGGPGGATTGTNQVGGNGGGCLLQGGAGGASNGTGAPSQGGDILLVPGVIGAGNVAASPYGRTGQVQMKFAAPFGDNNCGTTNLGTFGQCHGGLAYSPSVVLWNTNTSTSTAPQQTPWLIFRSNNDVTAGASTQIDWQMMAQPCTIAADSVAIAAGQNQTQCFNLTNQTANISGIPEWAFVFGATGGALQWNVNGSFFVQGIAAGMNLVANGAINLQGDGTGSTGADDLQIAQRGYQTPTGTAAKIIGGWNTASATDLYQILGIDNSGGSNIAGGDGFLAPGRGAGTGLQPKLELDGVNIQASGSNPQTYGEALATTVPTSITVASNANISATTILTPKTGITTAVVHSGGGGTGWAVNDTFTINGGTVSAICTVTGQSGGAVTSFTINSIGYGYTGGSAVATTKLVSATGASLTVDTTSSSSYYVAVNGTCTSAVATATVIPTITYTDPGGGSETLTASTGTCTTLGTNSVASLTSTLIRVKSGTNIQYATTTTSSPVYDLTVSLLQTASN